MWDSVHRGEKKNIFPFQESADAMFNSALIYEMAVLKLYAQPQLYAIKPDSPQYSEAKRLLKLLDYFLPMPTEDIAKVFSASVFLSVCRSLTLVALKSEYSSEESDTIS